MASPITKETLGYLAELARIDLPEEGRERLLHDLEHILDHFEELKSVPTDDVAPVAGGTLLENAYREDSDARSFDRNASVKQFPESKNGFLKIPPVFDNHE